MSKNVFFFYHINTIGGVETMFWELAKKYYRDYDITVYYMSGDQEQIKRLRRYVNVIKYNGEKVECEKAFFNYNLEPFLSHVKAKKCYEIIHADFKLQKNIKPNVDPRIDTYLAVSQTVADSFYDVIGVKCEVCPNPLTVEKVDSKPLFICAAQRLTSEKGGERIKELIRRLDGLEDFKYYFLLFSNDKLDINSPNVCMMKPRLDIRPFICACDLFVAVSDSEGRCYSVGEKLGYGTGNLLITPCPSFFEQGANEQNSIVLNFDMSNMDDVVLRIKELYKSNKIKHTFQPIKCVDYWDKYLVKGKPTYDGCKYYRVKATELYQRYRVYDLELGCIPQPDTEFIVDTFRLKLLQEYSAGSLVEVIEEVGKP